MAECEVTRYRGGNEDKLIALIERAFKESPVYSKLNYDAGEAELLLRSGANDEWEAAWVATFEGEPVGLLCACMFQIDCSTAFAACDRGLFVDPEFRGTGAALLLIEEYLVWAKLEGIKSIRLASSTGTDTERVEAFYASVGFEKIGVVTEYRGE